MNNDTHEPKHLVGHAETIMFQAELAPADMRTPLFLEAKDLLIRAETRQPGIGAWHLACISARMGQSQLCREWLLRAKTNGKAPDKATLESSPHLAPLRSEKWFAQFLKDL